jgi:hypothetical protein
MKPETRNTSWKILLATISLPLVTLLMMGALTSCDLVGNLLGGGNEDPTAPTNPVASFKVVITGSALVDGKINFGDELGLKITDNKNPNEPIKEGNIIADVSANWTATDKDGKELTPTFQWTIDGQNIEGATSNTLNLDPKFVGGSLALKVIFDGIT